jgi:hypothetical protein
VSVHMRPLLIRASPIGLPHECCDKRHSMTISGERDSTFVVSFANVHQLVLGVKSSDERYA